MVPGPLVPPAPALRGPRRSRRRRRAPPRRLRRPARRRRPLLLAPLAAAAGPARFPPLQTSRVRRRHGRRAEDAEHQLPEGRRPGRRAGLVAQARREARAARRRQGRRRRPPPRHPPASLEELNCPPPLLQLLCSVTFSSVQSSLCIQLKKMKGSKTAGSLLASAFPPFLVASLSPCSETRLKRMKIPV